MLHLRIVSPASATDSVIRRLTGDDDVTNVIALTGAAIEPEGDVVQCDIARASVNRLLDELDAIGIDGTGSVTVQRLELTMSGGFRQVAKHPSEEEDAVVWEEFAQRMDDVSRVSWSFIAFLMIATLLAAIGIVNDSSILIVGAMVLGPEFGPISAISFGLMLREFSRVGRATCTLIGGFLLAIAVTFGASSLARVSGWIDSGWVIDQQQQAQFIVQPDRWSLTVALLAGVAGTLSLTSEKSSALVGVFISVTTVPAASYMGLTLALGQTEEFSEAAAQLGLNITGMILAGFVTLIVLWSAWGSTGLRSRAGHAHASSGRHRH